jgi:hypothetical protein
VGTGCQTRPVCFALLADGLHTPRNGRRRRFAADLNAKRIELMDQILPRGASIAPEHDAADQAAVATRAARSFRRHQPRRPPLAKIRPGSPAPAMGLGTAEGVADPKA